MKERIAATASKRMGDGCGEGKVKVIEGRWFWAKGEIRVIVPAGPNEQNDDQKLSVADLDIYAWTSAFPKKYLPFRLPSYSLIPYFSLYPFISPNSLSIPPFRSRYDMISLITKIGSTGTPNSSSTS